MPVIFDPPSAPPISPDPPVLLPTAPQPYVLPDPQNWAVEQERLRHDQALFDHGEYAFFILMWQELDNRLGRVTRCSRCYGQTVNSRVANVYNQAAEERCPQCFGTTFEGGFKALIVRQSLWTFSEDNDTIGRRGIIEQATAAIQSTSDFQMRTGDHVVRGDGTRWTIQSLTAPHLRTGFQTPTNTGNIVAFNYGQAAKDDASAPSFAMPPHLTASQLHAVLNPPHPHRPIDYSDYEEVRGPLLAPYD
jgi:hypothetical protein